MEIIRREIKDRALWESEGILKRYKYNPILEAKKEHSWESKMVYNAAAFRIEGITYIVYRAMGHDHMSRLGIAWTKNGVDITGRLAFPVFEPVEEYETPSEADRLERSRENGGCEDPRITVIGNKIYMVYTAFSALCQIAIASIGVDDFKRLISRSAFGDYESEVGIREEWKRTWVRHGLIFPENVEKEIFSRNACVFPVEIDNRTVKYALIYRHQTSEVMIAYSDTPIGPWEDHSVFFLPTESWEGERMGICSPPIKTDNGLFFVYHGVDTVEKKQVRRNYRLGGVFLKFYMENGRIKTDIAKIKQPILEPDRGYEEQSDWLESRDLYAVFCCGALPFESKEDVKGDEEILVYYGAGDVRICVARVKNSTLKQFAEDK
ncbi:MAG: hypothetical protein KAU17_04265 [Spirochaetales bacterium]|nr:hypothetical protein [Spirochaetales bacterium]